MKMKHPQRAQELIVGTRVYVSGTKHNGFRGVIVQRPATPEYQSFDSLAVLLDEFDEPIKLYYHNLLILTQE